MYKIIRMKREGKNKVIKRGLTLDDVKEKQYAISKLESLFA